MTEPVRVNGALIPESAIAREAQNHPAPDFPAARQAAAAALVVRELLLQEARRRGCRPAPRHDEEGRREAEEDALIRALLEQALTLPAIEEPECRRYYDENGARFRAPDLVEASHILFAADPEDGAACEEAARQAEQTIAALRRDPAAFERLAASLSACTSARQGGSLGQLARGQSVPEFETFLFNLDPGQLCPVPVKTRYGAHVLRLGRRVDGRTLPFETVRARIAAYLADRQWAQEGGRYIRALAAQARIEGVTLSPDSETAGLGGGRTDGDGPAGQPGPPEAGPGAQP